jgi:hypothetical protein
MSNNGKAKLRKQAGEIDFNLIGWTLTICRTPDFPNLNSNQRQLHATKHGEEIGFSAYWLPARSVFCWCFAHQLHKSIRSRIHLHSSLTLPSISQRSSRAGPDARSGRQAAAKWGVA